MEAQRIENHRLRALLEKHEGFRSKPYRCSSGKLTIGIGRNIEDVGISEMEARLLLTNDIDRILREAIESFTWFKSLNIARQDVVLSMIFNLGLAGFKGFKRTISAIQYGNYNLAADEMLESAWAGQVGERAIELAAMMRSGRY